MRVGLRSGPALADGPATIERAGAGDLMQLASDVGPVPWQVGAVLVLAAGRGFDVAAASDLIAERLASVPRLRQKLVHLPPGCGRPIWVDDSGFDVRRHIGSLSCPPPGDEDALLRTAVTIVTQPLPPSRPLWKAAFVTGLAGGRVAIVVVFHHVLADGIGGLAVLANLADGAPPIAASPFPRPVPSCRALLSDALRARRRALALVRPAVRRFSHAAAELNPRGMARAPRTTLNQPTGVQRRVVVTRTDLRRVHAVAHAHSATVNDVALAAVTGALRALLARRGETVESLVVSVPVSARNSASSSDLGNQLGVMPVRLPVCTDRWERLDRIAALTRAQKTARRGASAAVLQPAFRALAAVGVLRWLINRQRLVNTFLTNLRGPDRVMSFAGASVTDVLPLTGITGNVTVSFAVFSYAGTLAIVIVADPERHPDLNVLAAFLRRELDALTSSIESDPD